ncbi:MAG: endo-1,4-beta-xylanase [Treponema sp.]|jgi:GH35 family endo-1,4-beta-xylanase|nr:endo-1,4-beta-xylanase [Treponema sp.]
MKIFPSFPLAAVIIAFVLGACNFSFGNSGDTVPHDEDEIATRLKEHVTTIVTHYKDKVLSWDVVNEAISPALSNPNDWKDCLRRKNRSGDIGSGQISWYDAIGPEYVEIAFKAARDADPNVKLYYNDFNLNDANKARAVYNMVRDINTRFSDYGGRPLIDGIGMQSHHHLETDPATVEASIQLFESLGVKIGISELDIQAVTYVNGTPQFSEHWQEEQARQYAAMFKIFITHAESIARVTFWGLDDETSWLSSTKPTLFNANFTAKPAFYAVEDPNAANFADGGALMALMPLHTRYTNRFLIGNIASPSDLSGNGTRFNYLKKHFNVVTAENAMKPDALRTSNKGFNFTQADTLVNAVKDAGLLMHGHTLVWHSQSPTWLTTRTK